MKKGELILKLATIYKIAKALEMEIKDLFDFIPNQEK
ncbi:helix-turn-helix domain-containing protein [Pedobacter sp. GR22-6]